MKTTIRKWGTSLAVRIPRVFAERVHLEENTTVHLTIRSGTLVIARAEPAITLESLVEQITDENRHDEIATFTQSSRPQCGCGGPLTFQ